MYGINDLIFDSLKLNLKLIGDKQYKTYCHIVRTVKDYNP